MINLFREQLKQTQHKYTFNNLFTLLKNFLLFVLYKYYFNIIIELDLYNQLINMFDSFIYKNCYIGVFSLLLYSKQKKTQNNILISTTFTFLVILFSLIPSSDRDIHIYEKSSLNINWDFILLKISLF